MRRCSSSGWRKLSFTGSYTPNPDANSQYAHVMPRLSIAWRIVRLNVTRDASSALLYAPNSPTYIG